MIPPSDTVLLFGRFHPLLVHLPIGLLVLLAFLELLARWPRFNKANASAGSILALAVPASIVTAVCGWLLSRGGGFAKYSRYLIGDILTITPAEIAGAPATRAASPAA